MAGLYAEISAESVYAIFFHEDHGMQQDNLFRELVESNFSVMGI
jgi:hypothetical protein